MDERLFHRRLYESACALLPPGEVVVCAVSGGADSIAMLHGLHEVNLRRRCDWRLVVAHLDHGLPYDSVSVRRFVKNMASKLGLTFIADAASVPQLSLDWRLSIEEAGRRVRYEFFGNAALQCGAKWIAVAHHADDQAETVLHRTLRGTGLRGLNGIPRRRRLKKGSDVRIVRPMLAFSREQLREYLIRRELAFMEDPTNADTAAATRNRFRHDLLPQLEREVNPKVRRALVRLSNQARRAAQAIRQVAREAMNRAITDATDLAHINVKARFSPTSEDKSLLLAIGPLRDLPAAIQAEVVSMALDRLECPRKAITSERIDAAASLLRMNGQHRQIQLPGAQLERRGEWLAIVRLSSPSSDKTRDDATDSVTSCETVAPPIHATEQPALPVPTQESRD